MSEIWPFDIKQQLPFKEVEIIRPFKCLMLMPFDKRFEQVAKQIEIAVQKSFQTFKEYFITPDVDVKRVDWITSSNAIQNDIWKEIIEADLIFCDITGYNPNVMIESGVCAAWKKLEQVVFIKDRFFKQESAFDIAPIRYFEYELTSDGLKNLEIIIGNIAYQSLLGFPDSIIPDKYLDMDIPININFINNNDDYRIYTPPYAHRRVIGDALEFGSSYLFSHSWASIGKKHFHNFKLEFEAKFVQPTQGGGYVGVGLRSTNYLANYSFLFYLRMDGSIACALPNEEPPKFYEDKQLRGISQFNVEDFHNFKFIFSDQELSIEIDGYSQLFKINEMKKVFPSGLIRFQSFLTRMAVKSIIVSE